MVWTMVADSCAACQTLCDPRAISLGFHHSSSCKKCASFSVGRIAYKVGGKRNSTIILVACTTPPNLQTMCGVQWVLRRANTEVLCTCCVPFACRHRIINFARPHPSLSGGRNTAQCQCMQNLIQIPVRTWPPNRRPLSARGECSGQQAACAAQTPRQNEKPRHDSSTDQGDP